MPNVPSALPESIGVCCPCRQNARDTQERGKRSRTIAGSTESLLELFGWHVARLYVRSHSGPEALAKSVNVIPIAIAGSRGPHRRSPAWKEHFRPLGYTDLPSAGSVSNGKLPRCPYALMIRCGWPLSSQRHTIHLARVGHPAHLDNSDKMKSCTNIVPSCKERNARQLQDVRVIKA